MLAVYDNSDDDRAPLILVYGPAGIGKTSLAITSPNCLYIPVLPEAPPRSAKCKRLDAAPDFGTLMSHMRALYKEQHGFSTIVIDSLDALEPFVIKETCRRMGWPDIETPSYGKGWVANDETWRMLISGVDALRRNRGIMIIWTALAEATNHEDPGTPPYKKYSLRLHKRAEKLVTQAADAVLFINTKTTMKELDTGFNQKTYVADGGGTRWAFTDARPAFLAKNRFNMPEMIMLDKQNPWISLSKYITYNPPAKKAVEPELPFNGAKPPLTIPADPPPTQTTIAEDLKGDFIPV